MLNEGLAGGEATSVCEPCFPIMDCDGEISTWTTDDARLSGLELFSLPGVRVPAAAPVEGDGVDDCAAAAADNLLARALMKLPSPDPQAPNVALAACAVSANEGAVTDGGAGAGVGSGGAVAVRRNPTPRDRGRRPPPPTG